MTIVKDIKVKKRRQPKKLAFYLLIVLPPMIQYLIFYVGVNFNSILMAFQSYDAMTGKFYFDGMVNFKRIVSEFQRHGHLLRALITSVVYYGFSLVVMSVAVFFAYYIYKKRRFSGIFRVVAFLPDIISNITLVLIFKYFTENAYPAIVEALTGKEVWGLLVDPDTVRGTLMAFCLMVGFGTQMIMLANAMSAIDQSVCEAATLDGITPWREFVHITLPNIFPTLSTFLIVGISNIFINQMCLFSFFDTGADPKLWTLGYYLYRGIKGASLTEYPYLSALGVLFTLIVVPITFAARRFFNKIDPTQ